MSDHTEPDDTTAASLARKLEELEQLLERTQDPQIPVLDELVEYNEESVIKPAAREGSRQQPASLNLDVMLDELESKIADELDTLVEILKDTIKDSVMSEIKSRLHEIQAQKPDDPH